jgi:hypothetical protein
VPWIIDYAIVHEAMRALRFRCNYYNSGAFAFLDPQSARTIAWVGPDDPTIRPAVLPFVQRVGEPYESTLASLAGKIWQEELPGRAWIMPMSHWAYELDHGSATWMPPLLERMELDPGLLVGRNNAAAIEFAVAESALMRSFLQRLLEMLSGSDFMLAFPGHAVLCMIHHHKQLWWQTSDTALADRLVAVVAPA